MKSGVCYIRVSTDKQEELSPDAQKRLLFDYAREHQIALGPDSFYMDIGISGRTADKRPAFRDMIAAAKSKEHPFDVILVWKFSRFARNQEESIVYKSLLRRANVEVVSISEPLPDGIMGGLIERILEWMDEYFSIRLSGEVMRGMTEKALRGGYLSSPPYGYQYQKGSPPSVHPEQAKIVRLIFEKYVREQASKAAIAKYLNLHGVTTRKGRKWEAKTVEYLLENPFYIGKVRWNYTNHAPGPARKEEREWILAEGSHAPLISRELFEAAEARTQSQRLSRTSSQASGASLPSGRIPARHWLSGFLRCSRCGGPLNYRSGRANQTPFFYCKNQTLGTCTRTQRFRVPDMEAEMQKGLALLFDAPSLSYQKIRPQASQSAELLLRLHQKQKELAQKEKRIRAAYLDGVDSLEIYKQGKKQLEQEQAELRERIGLLQKEETEAESSDPAELPLIRSAAQAFSLFLCPSLPLEAKCDAIRTLCTSIAFDKETQSLHFFISCGLPLPNRDYRSS